MPDATLYEGKDHLGALFDKRLPGLASTFRRLGFEVVQRRADHKPMMRLRSLK